MNLYLIIHYLCNFLSFWSLYKYCLSFFCLLVFSGKGSSSGVHVCYLQLWQFYHFNLVCEYVYEWTDFLFDDESLMILYATAQVIILIIIVVDIVIGIVFTWNDARWDHRSSQRQLQSTKRWWEEATRLRLWSRKCLPFFPWAVFVGSNSCTLERKSSTRFRKSTPAGSPIPTAIRCHLRFAWGCLRYGSRPLRQTACPGGRLSRSGSQWCQVASRRRKLAL